MTVLSKASLTTTLLIVLMATAAWTPWFQSNRVPPATAKKVQYFHEHKGLMTHAGSFSKSYDEFHHDLYDFIEKVM